MKQIEAIRDLADKNEKAHFKYSGYSFPSNRYDDYRTAAYSR